MPNIRLADLEDLKQNVFKKRPDVEDEYNKMKFVRKLQRELIKARIEKGLSQKELAELINTTQSVISRLESSDDPNPNLSTIFKISKALDKTLDISFV